MGAALAATALVYPGLRLEWMPEPSAGSAFRMERERGGEDRRTVWENARIELVMDGHDVSIRRCESLILDGKGESLSIRNAEGFIEPHAGSSGAQPLFDSVANLPLRKAEDGGAAVPLHAGAENLRFACPGAGGREWLIEIGSLTMQPARMWLFRTPGGREIRLTRASLRLSAEGRTYTVSSPALRAELMEGGVQLTGPAAGEIDGRRAWMAESARIEFPSGRISLDPPWMLFGEGRARRISDRGELPEPLRLNRFPRPFKSLQQQGRRGVGAAPSVESHGNNRPPD